MQERLHFLAVIGQLDALDRSSRVLNELVVSGSLVFLPMDAVAVAVFVNRPHGVGVETGGDIIMVTRLSEIAGSFGSAALFFAARRRLGEFARDIDEFFDATAYFVQIFFDAGAAVADDFPGARPGPSRCRGFESLDPRSNAVRANVSFSVRFRCAWFDFPYLVIRVGNEKQDFNHEGHEDHEGRSLNCPNPSCPS